MKRIVINKPKKIECKICKKYISLYGIPSHIKYTHNTSINDYVKKYGEFRKVKKDNKRNINKIVCKICGNIYSSVGMFVHLRDTHNISINDYVKKYGEYRKKFLDYKNRAKKYKIKCLICNDIFGSERLLSYHIRLKHNISKEKYVKKYYFNDKKQLCKCGCCGKVNLLNQYPYRIDYISGHNSVVNNPMKNHIYSNDTLKLMSKRAINRVNKSNKINSSGEILFKDILNKNNIRCIFQYETEYGCVDFYLLDYNMYIEIDGKYWHPEKYISLNFRQLNGAMGDYKKNKLKNIIRIYDTDLYNINNIQDMVKYKRILNFNITYYQKIINKEYFRNYIDRKGKDKLKKYVNLLLKFTRAFQPEFPFPENKENLDNIINTISRYDFNRIIENNTFKNNIYDIGINYLKSHFKSYWKSKYKSNSLSPYEAWYNDDIIKKIIEYRIGINDSGEIFDFSLHQLIRGLSARRFTVSFFKPLLAAAIYKHFLRNTNDPVVIDPCAGFGGRMIGFKAIYPNGTYIGIEPNPETYNELIKLSKNFSNVKLYNCKLEDYSGSVDCDLTFTSIPYFDNEIYSNKKEMSFDEWKIMMNSLLRNYKNLLINISEESYELLDFKYKNVYYIKNNTSHFDKNNSTKKELIMKV